MENQNNSLSLNTQNSQWPFTPQGPQEKPDALTLNKLNETPLSPPTVWKQPPALTALEKPKWDEKNSFEKVLKGNLLFKPGSENKKEIGELQDLLREKGYRINDSNGLYRGVYGEQTKKAVIRFQKMQGLSPDGVVGPKTLKALQEYDYRPVVLPEGLSLKDDKTDISHIHPKIQDAFPAIIQVWKDNSAPKPPVITSGNDSGHTSQNSLHYSDRAIDLRGREVSDATLKKMAEDLREKLGNGYFVQAEFFKDPNNDHIHIGYDPKRYK